MWKMLLLAVGMLSVLSLSIEGATLLPGHPGIPPHTLEGKLIFEDGRGPQIPEWDPWIGPALQTVDDWFGLDFHGNKELSARAVNLCGKRVRVSGRLEERTLNGLIPHKVRVLVVTELRTAGNDSVKKSVKVKMKGQFVFRADRADIFLPNARLVGQGRTYIVDLGDKRTLWHQAACLDGHTAVVTGTLEEDTIHVSTIHADEDFIQKTVLSGKLRQVITH